MKNTIRLTPILGLLAAALVPLYAAEHQQDNSQRKTADPKPYPLGTCVVSGEKLGGSMGDPVVFVNDGREIKLCCKSCLKDFDAAPKKFLAKVDEAAKKVKPYPLKTCLVSDEKLGGMGKPFVLIHDLQEVKLCCKSCKKDFDKEPEQFMSKLKKAVADTKSDQHADHQH